MSSEQSHKKRPWRLFLQTSVGICGFGTSRSSGGRSGDTCLALTSGATTNTGVCCFTPRWCSAGTPMLCPCTNTLYPSALLHIPQPTNCYTCLLGTDVNPTVQTLLQLQAISFCNSFPIHDQETSRKEILFRYDMNGASLICSCL